MKRFFVPLIAALLVLALAAPSALAQAPTPKVTITGLFDQITSMGRNFYDGNASRDNDREWYARTRFRPDFVFEVGRVKAVLGLEIDLQYGQSGPNDGGFPGNNSGVAGGAVTGNGTTTTGCKNNSNGCLDLNTDVGGMIEIKWVYTEFPLTGKDSVMPFIPVETMARAGGQPFGSLANTRAIYANGDFAGLSGVTTFAPNLKTNLAFVVVEDQLAGGNRAPATTRTSRGEDYASILSPEISPFKGLDIKPLFSWFHADGLTSSSSRHAVTNRRFVGTAGATCSTAANCSNTNSPAALGGGAPAGDSTNQEDRYTVGLDLRWRSGPFGFDPIVHYQWGHADHQAVRTNGTVGRVEGDLSSYIVDLIGSFQTGPFLLEARGVYSPGNKARDNLAQTIRYYQPLTTDGNYWSRWAAILASGDVDYFNGALLTNQARFIGYDRYGIAALGLRATYNITPAFNVYSWITQMWTAEKVDTDTGAAPGLGGGSVSRTTVSDRSWVEGDSRNVGTEVDLGFVWRFAPNVLLEVQGAYLFAGHALDTAECVVTGTPAPTNCGAGATAGVHTRREATDAYTLGTKLRFAF
ncbi:MAG: hypothetical protein DME04_10350 [Candidatus Rokuibacteriota bacterium]|nr:MAG: hypothetical protein DME04_10350 [Candidatus Rokubacteria bacterium]